MDAMELCSYYRTDLSKKHLLRNVLWDRVSVPCDGRKRTGRDGRRADIPTDECLSLRISESQFGECLGGHQNGISSSVI